MSMERIKQIIADNPGILQCELRAGIIPNFHFSSDQLIKLERRGEIIRIRATMHTKNGTFKLYLPGQVQIGEHHELR